MAYYPSLTLPVRAAAAGIQAARPISPGFDRCGRGQDRIRRAAVLPCLATRLHPPDVATETGPSRKALAAPLPGSPADRARRNPGQETHAGQRGSLDAAHRGLAADRSPAPPR